MRWRLVGIGRKKKVGRLEFECTDSRSMEEEFEPPLSMMEIENKKSRDEYDDVSTDEKEQIYRENTGRSLGHPFQKKKDVGRMHFRKKEACFDTRVEKNKGRTKTKFGRAADVDKESEEVKNLLEKVTDGKPVAGKSPNRPAPLTGVEESQEHNDDIEVEVPNREVGNSRSQPPMGIIRSTDACAQNKTLDNFGENQIDLVMGLNQGGAAAGPKSDVGHEMRNSWTKKF
ncbi:hypothetical protein L6452_43938 [Arctium lappa]|uniref:Uncharacterized protein n=1 Tax=Arctium lappa TaxID=4217 RepID=A0ACB8XEP2_ARCLA|nr:hypothetical protein L6452_43938 [Arctium lappa]